ncbi:hypothetical protein KZ483_15710 [Paenibacillus sp. sptzw28]|uniref:hypothetical protein n=1 Tax=Paenibacillus sp. sptzw28 TaxID=715179 RepID=UPI001C6F5D41|nr:hypothetical protein [Paenibacillus sp. sptzw28]QYR19375.1 hypothetical protein KZ483_15710 [Paenibacillus sp. sptzw28]
MKPVTSGNDNLNDLPSPSAEEINENRLPLRSEKKAHSKPHDEPTVASEALRYEHADRIYPDLDK